MNVLFTMELSNLLFIFIFVPSVFSSPLEKNLILNRVSNEAVTQSDYRLPDNVKPLTYDLVIVPFFENFTFVGVTTIEVTVTNITNQIILNQLDLNIRSITLTGNGIDVSQTFTTNNTLQRLIITANSLNVSSNYIITISYDGTLTENMLGFYRSSYVENGVTKWLAITQFESTYARQAFPCFDEPAFRAKFTVNIGRDEDQITLANYPFFNKSIPMPEYNNKVIDTYEQTGLMPTYLVAFSVSYFANQTQDKFRIFMRPEAKSDGDYLLSIGQTILDTIGNFLGVNYTLEKMDVVAVPDFDAGAMENWGLTTYREKYVLYNSTVNSVNDKQLLVAVVAHEFGHQWFGDLVTPEWWSYTWLNEAFATYFEYITPNIMEPTWGMLDQFVYDNLQYSLASDVGDPRPMTADVSTPTEIDSIFDYVIYEKGGSILRMTEHFLTTDVWKAGLQSYLKVNEYGTGTPGSLFDNLDNATFNKNVLPQGIQVTSILKDWTTQPGYPVVNVNTLTNPITLSQKPFALDSKHENLTWYIPLTYTDQSNVNFISTYPSAWLIPGNSNPVINSTSGWIIFNIQQTGFYRVNYDNSNWQKLIDQLNSNYSMIASVNRAQLLDDGLKLARYGNLDYSTALSLTKYLSNERDYVPWLSAANNLNYLTKQLYGTDAGNDLQLYARELLTNNFVALTSNRNVTEPHLTTKLRIKVVAWACDWKHPACESYANGIFQQWLSNQSIIIPTDVKEAVFCTGLRLNSDNETAFKGVWNYYLASNNYADKLSTMYALGCSESESSLLQYLSFLLGDGTVVRRQDKWIVYRAVVQRQFGISVALKFLVENYDALVTSIGDKRLASMISALGNNVVQQPHINQINALIANETLPANLRTSLNGTLPGILKRQTWTTDNSQSISTWFATNINSSSNIISSAFVLNFSLLLIVSLYYKIL